MKQGTKTKSLQKSSKDISATKAATMDAGSLERYHTPRIIYVYAMIDTSRLEAYIHSKDFNPNSPDIPKQYRCIRMVDNVLSAKDSEQGGEDIRIGLDPNYNVEITLLPFRPERENQLFITHVAPKDPNDNIFNPRTKRYFEGNIFFGTVDNVKTHEGGAGYDIYFQYHGFVFRWDPIFRVPRG